ncbi:MAG: peptidylprolyl isomerase [Flavobacteriaceae bacterium]|nr:peptidylprolyl isomerase [Flavobacteriaceae bacterium]
MTLLGTIRKKTWLLVGFIVIALASFLISPETLEKMLGKDPNIFGEVNGEKITREEYFETLMLLQQETAQQGIPSSILEEQAWQNIVQSKLIKQEFEKLGLELTDEFFWSQLPLDPMFAQYQDFKVQDFKKEVEALKEKGQVEEYNHWLRFRKNIESRIMARQVLANISLGITSNKKEAELIIKQRNDSANIDFVKIDYENFALKNPIKVSSQDLTEYIKKHPLSFKSPETRNLGIVFFQAKPTADDEAVVLAEINKLYNEGVDMGNGIESFKNNKNDSLFVLANSSIGFNPNYLAKEYLPQGIREQIANASIGQTFAPYKEHNYYIASKLLGKVTDSTGTTTYKVAHLVKEIKPSDATINKVHSQSTAFAQQVQGKSFNDFSNIAKKENFNFQNPKAVQRFQGILEDLGTDKDAEILKWAFDKKREKGDTEMFSTANGDRIIVYLNGKYAEGLADPESVREQIAPIVRNRILAKKITEKINTAKLSSLEQIEKLFGVNKESAKVNFHYPIVRTSPEPKVVGVAFGLAKNKLSQPIEGSTGVYVIINKGIETNKQEGDVKQIQTGLAQQFASVFPQAFMRSLLENAEIKDYRIEVYDKVNQH